MSVKLDTETRKKQILEAALQVVGEHGLNGLNMNDISAEVGIVPSGIYRHFGNKDEIIKGLLRLTESKLIEHLENLEKEDIPPVEKLKSLLVYHINFLRKNKGIPQVIFSDEVAFGASERRSFLFSMIKGYMSRIKSLVEECKQKGLIQDKTDSQVVAFAMISMAQSTAMILSLTGGEKDLGDTAQKAWDLFFGSFEKK